jgi:Gas vesicle protein
VCLLVAGEGKVKAPQKTNPVTRSHGGMEASRRFVTSPEDASLIEILDRVLDHGIVVDPSSRLRLPGLELHGAGEHLVIDWRDTYF